MDVNMPKPAPELFYKLSTSICLVQHPEVTRHRKPGARERVSSIDEIPLHNQKCQKQQTSASQEDVISVPIT
jgi:hypothetical protein